LKELEMVRNILTVVAAFILGGIAVFSFEALGHRIYPIPEDLDTSNYEQLAAYVNAAPSGALAFVLIAQSAGSIVGGAVCGFFGRSNSMLLSLVYGILALGMASLNLILIPHPLWMIVASLALPIPLSMAAGKIVSSSAFCKSC
jgi:hypothetical protein